MDITGWTLGDISNPTRHPFGDRSIAPGGGLVMFDSGSNPEVPGSITSSPGSISLNDSGDQVTLRDDGGTIQNSVAWSRFTSGMALNRTRDGTAAALRADHDEIPGAVGSTSPGTHVDGTPW